MGINDRENPLSKVIRISDIAQTTNLVENGAYTSDDCSSIASEIPATTNRRRKARAVDYQSIANRLQLKSRRHARRQNQLTFVRTLVGLEETEVEDELSWVPEYGQSAFSLLLSESSKMMAWNRFVEMTEGEQLSLIGSKEMSHGGASEHDACQEEISVTMQTSSDNMRCVHPSYSSEQCFSRVEKHMKSLLSRRHLPLGLLENLEANLREAFISAPDSHYSPDVASPFERLLIHALTQYLGLQSFSQGDDKDRRLTVFNNRKAFSPPKLMLAEFLEWKSGKFRTAHK